MLAAILDAHAGRPLQDAEIADYVWPAGTPDVQVLARRLAAGDGAAAWSGAVAWEPER